MRVFLFAFFFFLLLGFVELQLPASARFVSLFSAFYICVIARVRFLTPVLVFALVACLRWFSLFFRVSRGLCAV